MKQIIFINYYLCKINHFSLYMFYLYYLLSHINDQIKLQLMFMHLKY